MYVLVKLFDFNTNQGQIIDSYSLDEVQALKAADKWDYPEEDDRKADDIGSESGSESGSDPEPEPAPEADDLDVI
jgi:hypothetical protein